MSQHQFTTTRNERVEAAVAAVRKGRGVLVVDDEDRENEGDIIFSAASTTPSIRCSVILSIHLWWRTLTFLLIFRTEAKAYLNVKHQTITVRTNGKMTVYRLIMSISADITWLS